MMKTMSVAFAVTFVTACGGEGGGNGEELVGAWTGASFFGEVSMTFAADGNVELISPDGEVASGTWEADGERLTLDGLPFETGRLTATYVVDGDFFMFPALAPDGDVDGVVGTWRGDTTTDEGTRERTIELAAGGTGHITADGEAPGTVLDVDLTWELDPGLLRLAWDNPGEGSTTSTYFALPDVALGALFLERSAPAP